MFATLTNDKTKTDVQGKPKRADTAPGERDAPARSSVWQSLATRPTAIQPKLTVSQVNDPQEHEVDQIADRVTRMTAPPANISKLAYGPPGPAPPAQAYPGQAPPAQAYPGQVPPAQAPAAAPLDFVGQARSDAIAALDWTVERLHHAISARDGIGIIPHDVDDALYRFFPGFDTKFLDDILARIQPMGGWIPNVPVHSVPRPAPAGFRDAALLNQVNTPAHTLVRRVLPMMDPGPDYVVVFPEWYNDAALQATRLLHEFFHFLFVGMYHNKPLNDAFGWQGFVSQVGGLRTGPMIDKLYPVR